MRSLKGTITTETRWGDFWVSRFVDMKNETNYSCCVHNQPRSWSSFLVSCRNETDAVGLTSVDCIVQELETAETAAVTQLLTEILLDEPGTGAAGAGVLGQGSKETGGGVMKMVAVSPEAWTKSENRTKQTETDHPQVRLA